MLHDRPLIPQLRMMPPPRLEDAPRIELVSTESRWDAYSSLQGYGVTPELVYRVLRSAEDGHPREQCELFERNWEVDGHVMGQVNGRIDGVAGKEHIIVPGDTTSPLATKAAEVMRAALSTANTEEMIEHQLSAFYFGWAASEPQWEFVDGWWVPTWFVNMPQTRQIFDDHDAPYLTTDLNPYPGVPLSSAWMVNYTRHRRAARGGAGRAVAWWGLFKRMSVRDWIVFAEKFGIPIVMGKWKNNAPEESRRILRQAIADIGEGGQAVFNEAAEIIISDHAQRSGDAKSLHPSVVGLCNAEMSKALTGATLNVESGGPGSFALGKVHEARAIAMQIADARRMQRAFKRSVSAWFAFLNNVPPAAAPWLRMLVVPEMDPLTRVKVASILANELGLELDGDLLLAETGNRRPASPESAAKGTKSAGTSDPEPAPAPGEE